ncbi:polycomb complex protein BMI-1 isoform X3 [Hydra vulgaris]|uniref:Polycomb complex protein BMI-1 isoform X3 n=1 Tax=Hydra vulgaris TaxID=6087 RepID=A0ABM4CX84_HYDVU
MQRLLKLQELNPYLTCMLCSGYLIDATTLVECSHSFCRSCLLKYLESSYNCPKCTTEIHKTKPLEYTRSDPVLQEIVYKLVPELYFEEEKRREKWQKIDKNIENLDKPGSFEFTKDLFNESRILVTLKYFRGTSRIERIKTESVLQMFPTRYLCCKPNMPVKVLKKFVQYKFDISSETFQIDLWRGDETLMDNLTLKQIVQIYGLYRERKPLELHFSVYPNSSDNKETDGTQNDENVAS